MPSRPDRRLQIIFFTVLLDLLGFGIIIPLLPFYAKDLGADALTVGMLSTAYSLAQLSSSGAWGRLSDRVGRRPVLLGTIAFSAVAMLIFGLAESLTVLFISRLLAGVAAGNIGAAQAYIADITAPSERAKGMGMIGAAFGLGFIFGPAVGGPLFQIHHMAPGLAASALAVLNLLLAYRFLPESHPRHTGVSAAGETAPTPPDLQPSLKEALALPGVGAVISLFFIQNAGFSVLHTVFSLSSARLFGLDQTHIGYLFAYIGFFAVLVQGGLIGRLSKLFAANRLTAGGLALLTLAMVVVGLAPSIPFLLVGLGMVGFGNGVATPALSGLLSQRVAASNQGTLLGIAQAAGSLGRIVGPLMGGYVYDQHGPRTPYLMAAGVLSLATLLAITDVLKHHDVPAGRPSHR